MRYKGRNENCTHDERVAASCLTAWLSARLISLENCVWFINITCAHVGPEGRVEILANSLRAQ